MKLRILLFFVLTLFLRTIFAQNIGYEDIPRWVKKVTIPEKSIFSKYEIASGFYLTLVDYQMNLETNEVFNHEVINVISYSGITNASQISIVYDTLYQKIKIHHLYIWRNGIKIDRTDKLSLELMNNEYELSQGVYNGKTTAYDILDDIRKDDLIDFAYTIIGDNPMFNNEKFLLLSLETLNPVDLYYIRILYSKDRDYLYKCKNSDSLISKSEINGFCQLEIQQQNLKALKIEENIPSWIVPYNYFSLSSFKSWKEVNKWAQEVFALKEDPNLDEVFNEIFKGNETIDDKINKIINYVQDDIRYMGIESGIGSIKPSPPDNVVKKRFGDCKDKSLLLVTLLKKIGIKEVFPALVNTDLQNEVDRQFPNNEIFNHCIVTFEYDDKTFWVDPSIPMQGGDYKNLGMFDYGKALVIGKPADTLQKMILNDIKSNTEVVDEYTISSFTEPAKLKMTSKRYGLEADSRRMMLEYYSTNNLEEQITKDLKLLFPIANPTSEIKIDDDVENNIITTTYNYVIDGLWQDGDKGTSEITKGLWVFKYEPVFLYDYFKVSSMEDRVYDYELAYPFDLKYKVIFHLPKDIFIIDDYDMFENAAFVYEEKVEQLSSNSFQIEYNLKTKSNCINKKDYKEMCNQKNTIIKEFPLVIYFLK